MNKKKKTLSYMSRTVNSGSPFSFIFFPPLFSLNSLNFFLPITFPYRFSSSSSYFSPLRTPHPSILYILIYWCLNSTLFQRLFSISTSASSSFSLPYFLSLCLSTFLLAHSFTWSLFFSHVYLDSPINQQPRHAGSSLPRNYRALTHSSFTRTTLQALYIFHYYYQLLYVYYTYMYIYIQTIHEKMRLWEKFFSCIFCIKLRKCGRMKI